MEKCYLYIRIFCCYLLRVLMKISNYILEILFIIYNKNKTNVEDKMCIPTDNVKF